jgi:hypothetical protein
VFVTEHWGISTGFNWDIAAKVVATESTGIVFQNDCIHAELDYSRNGTYNGALGPSSTVLLRITFPLLGGRPL